MTKYKIKWETEVEAQDARQARILAAEELLNEEYYIERTPEKMGKEMSFNIERLEG